MLVFEGFYSNEHHPAIFDLKIDDLSPLKIGAAARGPDSPRIRQPSHGDASLAQTCPPLSLVTSLPPPPPTIGRNMPPSPNASLPSLNSILHVDISTYRISRSYDRIQVTYCSGFTLSQFTKSICTNSILLTPRKYTTGLSLCCIA